VSAETPPATVEVPRWVADEMLGRLARYLRFLGHDTVYVRGIDDDAVRALARSERRVLLTRDRDLAARAERALLLRSVAVLPQLREVRAAFPSMPVTVSFDRCPECNSPLGIWRPPTDGTPWPAGVPRDAAGPDRPVWECALCSRCYWEGSHAPRIRALIAQAWSGEGSA
jgi:uncharacterized protein with PIN domain